MIRTMFSLVDVLKNWLKKKVNVNLRDWEIGMRQEAKT